MERNELLPYISDISMLEELLSKVFSKRLNIIKIKKHNDKNLCLRGYNNKDIWYIELDIEPKKLVFRGTANPQNKFYHEKYIYDILASNTNLPVPKVYHIESDNSVSWMIMDYMPGVTFRWFLDKRNDLLNDIWIELGKAIAQIVSCKKTDEYEASRTKESENILKYIMECRRELIIDDIRRDNRIFLDVIDNYTPRLNCPDLDILLQYKNGKWRVSGIIDVEHMNYGDARYLVMLYDTVGGAFFINTLLDTLNDDFDNYVTFVKAQNELKKYY